MHRSVVLLALTLFAVALAPLPAAASTPTYVLVGDITEDECDNAAPEFVSFIRANPHGQFSFSQCVNFKYIDPIASQRYFVAPSGQLTFGFVVMLKDNPSALWGPTLDATYTITVTVTDTTPGINASSSNSATVTLFGSKSTLAPAGAVANGLQANSGGTAYAFVNIPVNADWAESAVSISVQTSQSSRQNGAPWIQSCSTGVNQSGGLTCTYPLQWTDFRNGFGHSPKRRRAEHRTAREFAERRIRALRDARRGIPAPGISGRHALCPARRRRHILVCGIDDLGNFIPNWEHASCDHRVEFGRQDDVHRGALAQ